MPVLVVVRHPQNDSETRGREAFFAGVRRWWLPGERLRRTAGLLGGARTPEPTQHQDI